MLRTVQSVLVSFGTVYRFEAGCNWSLKYVGLGNVIRHRHGTGGMRYGRDEATVVLPQLFGQVRLGGVPVAAGFTEPSLS